MSILFNIFSFIFGSVLLFTCFVLIVTKCWAEGNPKDFSPEELKDSIKPLWVGSVVGYCGEFVFVNSFGLIGGIFAGLIIMAGFVMGFYVYLSKKAAVNERRS